MTAMTIVQAAQQAPAGATVIAQTRKTYSGPLQPPEDMLTIDIGDKIDVRHFGR